MKRIISFLLALTFCLVLFAGCSFLPDEIKLCDVNFYVDGEIYSTKTVVMGQTVGMPKNPEKENFVFTGWRVDGVVSYMYDFSSKVITDLDLHACFTVDTVKVGNLIAQNTLKSTVAVIGKSYNLYPGSLIESSYFMSQGSGVIIDISDGYCYVLTNAHVVEKNKDYSKLKITVEDAWGNSYEASIYKNSNKSTNAFSKDFDLALVCFELPEKYAFTEIVMGEDPKVDDFVVSIGNPGGLINLVTYGKTLGYQSVKGEDGTAADLVSFEVIIHNAPIAHGSSGGALVDTYGKLVGLNFAGYESGEYGCAIPLSKIKDFLSVYVY
ncbi:MAG: trypsin-like peptidase domain-containing protein [Clostridia bacterium]|nr:trypsin-like peptidase domain-containing protein [Clostridia bacterium]